MNDSIRLYGRIFLEMEIHAVTGLRIGGSPAELAIGSLDNPVIRDPLTQRPYIPGSSLRGKMRSLWEKATNRDQTFFIRASFPEVRIHMPEFDTPKKGEHEDEDTYKQRLKSAKAGYATLIDEDPVCRIFGVTGDQPVSNPTRLIVHDAPLTNKSAEELNEHAQTDQPYTETKWEAVIDRITSAAVPRQMERVPAGAVFGPCRMSYAIFGTTNNKLTDIEWFFDIIQMLQLVEDDYLGSSGSRGSGSIEFRNLKLHLRMTPDLQNLDETQHRYMQRQTLGAEGYDTVEALWNASGTIYDQLWAFFPQMGQA